MSIKLQAAIAGDIVRIRATISDFNSPPYAPMLYDPDSHSIQLYDPFGNPSGSPYTGPTRDSLGMWHQDIPTPSGGPAGNWRVDWQTLKASNQTTGRIFFIVTV